VTGSALAEPAAHAALPDRDADQRRRAFVHVIGDLNQANTRLARHRKAILHILADYERERRRLAEQAVRLDNSRRALLHILQDAHNSNLRLENGRKAMIHIMGDLRDTTEEMQRREQELREKQEQLVQSAKLATLGELTTGVAHELNNPLNNIGLFIGNVSDLIESGSTDKQKMLVDLQKALGQVRKASEIISHLRTFGRMAPSSREAVSLNDVIRQALSLLHEQLRLREVDVEVTLCSDEPCVFGNAIQLEQVVLNLLTNARDAVGGVSRKAISIRSELQGSMVRLLVQDSGPGIPPGLEGRVFDPFFTTKEVGEGTGLGLSITYGIARDHDGTITVHNRPGDGATFIVELPRATGAETRREAP
jgi:C4-dicarboxylate-specific signal transduction histidine kinase